MPERGLEYLKEKEDEGRRGQAYVEEVYRQRQVETFLRLALM